MNHKTITIKLFSTILLILGIFCIVTLFIQPFIINSTSILLLLSGLVFIFISITWLIGIKFILSDYYLILWLVLSASLAMYEDNKILSIVGITISTIMTIWAIIIEIQEHRKVKE